MVLLHEVFDEMVKALTPVVKVMGERFNEAMRAMNIWWVPARDAHRAEVRRIHTNYHQRRRSRKKRR